MNFVFDGMTPELQNYLDHQASYRPLADATYPVYREAEKAWEAAGKPTDGSLKEEKDRLYKAHYGGLDAHRNKGQKMADDLPEGLLKRYNRGRKEWMCRDETASGDPTEQTSPSGEYRLVITRHSTGPGTWNYSKGKVFRGDHLVATVCRNYGAFPHAWVDKHLNGHSYLICGEDYQGQTIIELDTGKRVDNLPKAAHQGHGFCWADITPSPNGTILAVAGCYWACPYEVVLYDFTEPMNPPWVELMRDSDNEAFLGWVDDNTGRIGRRYEWSKTYNKREHELTMEESEEIDRLEAAGTPYKDLWEDRADEVPWTRPSFLEIARKHFDETLAWWREKNLNLSEVPDHDKHIDLLLARLTTEEKQALLEDKKMADLLTWRDEQHRSMTT